MAMSCRGVWRAKPSASGVATDCHVSVSTEQTTVRNTIIDHARLFGLLLFEWHLRCGLQTTRANAGRLAGLHNQLKAHPPSMRSMSAQPT